MVQVAMTRPQFEAKAVELRQRGMTVAGDKGTLEKDGCKVSYDYDGATMTCVVVKKPFLMPTGMIEGQIRDWLGEA